MNKTPMLRSLPLLRLALALVVGTALSTSASAGLLASFENDAEGWTINAAENAAYAISGFSTTDGVTDGAYSMIITGTAAPSYGQLLVSPGSAALTAQLATATQVSIDATTAPGAFGFGTQWTAVINNPELGYTSLDAFSYSGSVGPGASGHLSWNITPAQRAVLAGSANSSTLIFQVGGGASGTMYVDNVRLAQIPEPSSIAVLTLASSAALRLRRR